ncbi:MAG: penicillin-binding protein [Alphaproteobacteria bacterium]|nr:MAG: penicillin-binding protein [Alphaproteobacteria bacterium]
MIWKHARRQAILIDGDRRSSVFMAQSRLSILGVCFALGYLLVMVRLLDLAVVQNESLFQEPSMSVAVAKAQDIKSLTPRRGDIYDRHGFLLATTLKTPSLFVDPSLVFDEAFLSASLMKIIPDLDRLKISSVMQGKNRFGWIAHNITPAQQQAVLEIGDPSLGFKYEYKRVYPQGALFAHLVGYTDRDGLGLAGIERGYDDVLSAGEDVHLSLDLRLQHVVRRELGRAMDEFTAKAGSGIILDVHTGEVLAGVSLPDFDLNAAGDAKDREIFNRLTLGVYELGSMFKIFSTAALLELHNVPMSKTFDARKPLKIGRFTISDYHAKKRILTIPEVFMYSSNIGSALMGQMIGGKALRAFYADLGLLDAMRFDIREIGRPIVPKVWRKSTTLTASYGHGLATTPLQMSAAVASIVNGGMAVRPVLVKVDEDAIAQVKTDVRVISEETSEKMRKLLRLVVTKGTGRNADVKGYALGGKTGTAEKSVGGYYRRDKLISSFVGAFPMDNPRYVLMVMVDEPHGNKKSYGYATAGWVAAPAVKRILTSMASILGLPADQYDADNDMAASLEPYLHDKKKKKIGGKSLVSY